ncbi:MAG TPA: hypothetical protein VHD36_01500 [Pirellulales bacterium]|nr:hypothetical protein [Pirellulales bacterium]
MKGVVCALLAGAVAGFVASLGAAGNGAAIGSLLTAFDAREAAAAPGDRPAVLGDNERPAPARPVPTDPHELDVAYAEASLKLLQLDLQKMTDLQSRVHGSITASQFDRVDGMVRVAEDNLRMVKAGNPSRGALNVMRAREAVRTAEFVLKTARQVKAAANAISDIQLTRLGVEVEVERLMLARAEQAAKTDSPLDDLAWENDQLRDEVQRLRYRFEALTARR